MKLSLPSLVLLGGVLAGCTMNGPQNLELHEVLLYGATQERIGWVYGTTPGGARTDLKLGDQTLELRPQVQDPLALPGTLSVNGKATYRVPTAATPQKVTVTRAPGGQSFSVRANDDLTAVFFTDGRAWFKLTERLASGTVVTVPARTNTALRGAGQLTDAEADALGTALLGQGQLAVAVLADSAIPDAALNVQPAPKAYLRTALYLQGGVSTTLGSAAPTTPTPPTTPTTPTTPGGSVTARELARGNNSTYSGQNATVFLSRSASDLAGTWRTAYGNQLPQPTPPAVNFEASSVVTFFLGQRPTGGYGVQYVSARASGDTAVVTVRTTAPGPGSITTQALTSPFLSVTVSGRFTRAVVQDESGRVLAQSN